MVAKEWEKRKSFYFYFFYLLKRKKQIFFLVNMTYVCVRAGSGAGAVIWIYGSAELEPKEIFTAPQPQHRIPDLVELASFLPDLLKKSTDLDPYRSYRCPDIKTSKCSLKHNENVITYITVGVFVANLALYWCDKNSHDPQNCCGLLVYLSPPLIPWLSWLRCRTARTIMVVLLRLTIRMVR